MALCWLLPGPLAAEGLEGRRLQPSADLKAGVTTAISDLLTRSSAPEGQVLGALVADDSPSRLLVEVSYSGLAGYRLRGLVLDAKMRPMREVSVAAVTLEEPDGEAALAFDLLDGRSGSDSQSRYLLIEVLESGRTLAVDRHWFDLPRRWGKGGAAVTAGLSGEEAGPWPEPLRRIEITPVPVGRAAELSSGLAGHIVGGERPARVVPPRAKDPHGTEVVPPGAKDPHGTGRPLQRPEREPRRPLVRDKRSGRDSEPEARRPQVVDKRSDRRSEPEAPRPQVRDKRSDSESRRQVVRDKRSDRRSESGAGRPQVRDKRSESESRRPQVRDRRSGSDESASRPPVRDRRSDTGSLWDRVSDERSDRRPDSGARRPNVVDKRKGGLTLGLEPEATEQGALGPSTYEIDLLVDWQPDPAVDLEVRDLVPFSRVYQDQNDTSGFYYYRPDSYRLAWDDADGLALHMLYQAGLEGSAGDVLIRMTLDAGLDPREIDVVRALLEAQSSRGSITYFRQLGPIQIDSEPEVRLAEDLEQLFDIPADKVRASGVSDPLGRLDVALVTDSVTKENLQLALVEGGGLGGRVVLAPSGGAVPPQVIPFAVDPTDEETYPRLYWWPDEEWINPYPYPIRPRWLHVLRLVHDRPVVYSWDLGSERVPPGSTLWIDPAPVPAAIRDGALRSWIDFDLDDGCAPCHQTVAAALTGGVSDVAATEIVFRALSPLADSGATEIAFEVRSRYFHPSSRTLRSHPVIVIAEDGQSYPIGPIYPAAAEAGGEALFEYRLRLVMPDGRVLGGDRWVPGTGLYQPLGAAQLEAAAGTAWAGTR